MSVENEKATGQQTGEQLCLIWHMSTILGGKWKLPIVCMLAGGPPLRNSVIKRKQGDITGVYSDTEVVVGKAFDAYIIMKVD